MTTKSKQRILEDIIAYNKMFSYNILPEEAEEFATLIDRLDRLWIRQQKLDEKSLSQLYLDGDRIRLPFDIPTSEELLVAIKDNIEYIEASRTECKEKGVLETFELEYNKLEKAYLNLKVDIESYVRFHPTKEMDKL